LNVTVKEPVVERAPGCACIGALEYAKRLSAGIHRCGNQGIDRYCIGGQVSDAIVRRSPIRAAI